MAEAPIARPAQVTWTRRSGYEDVIYETSGDGIARITINRPDCDGQVGMMAVAGSATLLYYTTDEGREGKEAYLEKRKPDFSRFKRYP